MTLSITVGDRMFLGMQDFDFTKFTQICPNFVWIYSNFIRIAQIYPNFTQIRPKILLRDAAASPSCIPSSDGSDFIVTSFTSLTIQKINTFAEKKHCLQHL